ncbi:phage portal protein [Tepidiforma thermophila]|uniref:SPP1 Gp6-like portal protein n=1 Tax=Tepidiforma thermophila (strain KCTC 52669 / CGMCC 1.13589 / G233) TaxID=2761530 RepID=A0A2A9HDY0_TEPT2|nr:phage portal protein [Tepidiforma thermophila]PFG73342.1 SPP1 Gp6-like portal protein [Tepidiforma thermophila]
MPYQLPLPDVPLPLQLRQLDHERMGRYRDNLAFYQGRHWTGRGRRGERRLTFNYARAIVDKVTGYLLAGAAVQVVGDDSPAGIERARAAEQALRRVEAANGLSQLDFETELDCAILGDGAYRVAWDAAAGEVRVTAPDVQGLFAWREPADPARLTAVAHRYRAGDEELVEWWSAETFELWRGSELADRVPNPYGFIPYVIFPNLREPKEAWGASDLPPVMEANRELNRAFSQLSQVLELSGNPIAVLEGVTGSEDITVEPGAIWEVPEDARAYLLDLLQGGGVALHTAYIDLLYRVIHDLGESPRTAFGHNPQGLSGVALNMELDPIARKVERKRRIRTAVYERRAWMVLQLLARFTGLEVEGLRPVMQWGPVLPADRSRQVQDARALVEAGIISRRTAAATLGIDDPELERAFVREEAG